ncbi:hypothetical protein HYH02_002970 [Chlamydomonas schloesseri]|uniref:SBP-type domain-containing protein n=1 Tax=Chlamydomonas schloesseri TaxID=2026947 RepID=A0A835WS91_9CHLO|nr:hypothetical protein HYH02_002970 [Chlamydomonas schloesseri]|eukprot:KAG2452740.1 hypothetical protein HYH02_002970 [Chlamydomonas schloesseri]
MRACHKCTALHPLTAFDGERRCCRRSLQKLARRRQQGRREAAEAAEAAAAADAILEGADVSDAAATAGAAGSGRSAAAKRKTKTAGSSVSAAAPAPSSKAAKAAARRITVPVNVCSYNDSSAATTESAPPRKQPRRGARRHAGDHHAGSGSGSGSGSMDDGGRAAAPRLAAAAVAGDAGLLRADRDGRRQVTSASGGAAGAMDTTAAAAGAARGGAAAAGSPLDGAAAAADGGANPGLKVLSSGRQRHWSAAAVQESQRLLHEWSQHHGSSHTGGGANTATGATSALAVPAKLAIDDDCHVQNSCDAAAAAPAASGGCKRPLGDVVSDAAGAGAPVAWLQHTAGGGGSRGSSDANGKACQLPPSPPQRRRRTASASPLCASGLLLAANAMQLPAQPLAQQPMQHLQHLQHLQLAQQLPQQGTTPGCCPPERPPAPATQLQRSASGGSSTNSFGSAGCGAAAQAQPQTQTQQRQQVPWSDGLLAPSAPSLAGYAVQASPLVACVQQRAVVTTAVQIVHALRFDAPMAPVYCGRAAVDSTTEPSAPLDTHAMVGPTVDAAAGLLAWASYPDELAVAHRSQLQQQQQQQSAALELLPAGRSSPQLPRLREFEVMLFSKPSTITPLSGPEEQQVRSEPSPLLVLPPPAATAATAAAAGGGGLHHTSACISGSAGVFGCGRWAAADSSCGDGEASGGGSGHSASAAAQARRTARQQLQSSAHTGELLRAAELLGAPEILDSLMDNNGILRAPPPPPPQQQPQQEQQVAVPPRLQASAPLGSRPAASARLWALHAGGDAGAESSVLRFGRVEAYLPEAMAAVPAAGSYSGLSALEFDTSGPAHATLGEADFGACVPGNWNTGPAMAAPATQQLQQLTAWGPGSIARGSSWPNGPSPQPQPQSLRGVGMWGSGPLAERAGSNSGIVRPAGAHCGMDLRPYVANSQPWQQPLQLQQQQQDAQMRPLLLLTGNNNIAPDSRWFGQPQMQPQPLLHQYSSSAGRQPAAPSPPLYQQHMLRQSPPPAQLQQEQQRGNAVPDGRSCQMAAQGSKQARPDGTWEWPQEEVRSSSSGRQQLPAPWAKPPTDTSFVNVMNGYSVAMNRA